MSSDAAEKIAPVEYPRCLTLGVDKDEELGVWKAYGYALFSGVTFHAATVQDALDGLRIEIKKLIRDLPEKFGEYYFIS